MNLFCNRPFALGAFVAAGVAFVASFSFVSHRWIFALAFLAVAAVLFIVALIRRRCGAVSSTAILACLLSGLLLFSSWGFFDRQIGFLEQTGEKEVFAEGIVEERLSTSPNQTRFSFSLKEIDGKRVNQKVVLRCEYLSALRAGERIRVCGTVSNMQTLLSQENFTYRIADGFSGMLNCETAEDCMLLSSGEKSLFLRLSEWNTALSERLSSNIGGREGGLAAALILGNRNFLSPQDTLAFRRTGISHFLALSGLHVGILLAALERLLRLFRLPRKGRVVAMILLSLGYLAVTGASPSTLRAVFMADLLAGAFLFRESYDSPTAIFVALFAILFFQPYSVVDSGLWLSFFAAGGNLPGDPISHNQIFKALEFLHAVLKSHPPGIDLIERLQINVSVKRIRTIFTTIAICLFVLFRFLMIQFLLKSPGISTHIFEIFFYPPPKSFLSLVTV